MPRIAAEYDSGAPSVPTTKVIVPAQPISCRALTYSSDDKSWSNPLLRTSATTPTIVDGCRDQA